MAAKTTAPDHQVTYFYYRVDLTIDPPLAAAVVKTFPNNYLALKNKKDEDVRMVDGVITVVSTNITSVLAQHNPDNMLSGYAELKKEFGQLCTLVAKTSSTLEGHILIRRSEDEQAPEFFRLVSHGSVAVTEAAVLAFPDGTKLPIPSGEGL